MLDREKVIKRLEECLSASCRGFRTCPYSDNEWDAVKAAIAMLREQEPVKPIIRGGFYLAECGNCNEIISLYCVYCPNCGRKVKWDG